jgi:peptidoglycan/xylan/chitin deacetylase (PgdA/CDA1 family)
MLASRNVDVGSHTYWHPDFRRERERLNKEEFAALLASQLNRSKAILREKLGVEARFLAWPYGIADEQMRSQARRSGYEAALILGNRNASATDGSYALPRQMVVDQVGVQGLLRRLEHGPACVP